MVMMMMVMMAKVANKMNAAMTTLVMLVRSPYCYDECYTEYL